MTEAKYFDFNHGNYTMVNSNRYTATYDYDERGNIKSLKRRGVDISNKCFLGYQIDDLDYSYETNNSNRLNKIIENASGSAANKGFKPSSGTYSYDNNGNRTNDPS